MIIGDKYQEVEKKSEYLHFKRICYLGFNVIALKKKHNLWKGVGVHHKSHDKDSLLYNNKLQLNSSRHVTNLLPHPTT